MKITFFSRAFANVIDPLANKGLGIDRIRLEGYNLTFYYKESEAAKLVIDRTDISETLDYNIETGKISQVFSILNRVDNQLVSLEIRPIGMTLLFEINR